MQELSGDERITQSLGFTTSYGKNWEAWQVFRELYANARDEGGDVSNVACVPAPGRTTIVVRCPEVAALYAERDAIILPADASWHAADETIAISLDPSTHLYYKGVRVSENSTALTYNVLEQQKLTEDRTLENLYAYCDTIERFIMSTSPDETLIHRVVTASCLKESFEGINLDWEVWRTPSEAFLTVAERLWTLDSKRYAKLRNIIARHRPQLTEPTPIQLSPFRQQMLDRAISLVARMDVDPSIASAIHVAPLGDSVLGRYNKATGIVWLSPVLFDQGTKALVSCLYEELVHAHTGKADCTYNLQTYLFNRIISLYEEHVIGEAI
jgi:hypothetical protein